MDAPASHPTPDTPTVSRPPREEQGEHRFLIHDVPWSTYCAMRDLLDRPGLRMTYLAGTLELMSPSETHEVQKKVLARLLELWALERGVRLYCYGSTTFRRELAERGLEPDECYTRDAPLDDAPDLAIEVIVSAPLLDKLAVYSGLGVREVWIWQNGQLAIHCLRGDVYERTERSERFPELDVAELARFALVPDPHDALIAYRAALRG